jgi:hypothetical protein
MIGMIMTQSTLLHTGLNESDPYSQFHDYHLTRSHGTHETEQIQTQLTLGIPV